MKLLRTTSLFALSLVAGVLLLLPVFLFAQDSTTVADPAVPATWSQLASYGIALALGLALPYLVNALERVSTFLADQPVIVKRTFVGLLSGAVTLSCAWLAQKFPWFPWDPEPVQGLILSSLAFGTYGGDKAKEANATANEAKAIAAETRELQAKP